MKRVLVPNSAPNYSVDPETGDVQIRPRSKLLERETSTVERDHALDLVHERLAVATELFQNYGDAGKRGVSFALTWVFEYFTSQGIPPATLKPIEAVMGALIDSESGVSSPIFEPVRNRIKGGGSGRPKTPIETREFRDLQAVVAQCCIEHCKRDKIRPPKQEGLKLAASLIRQSKWGVKPTPAQLGKIREHVAGSPHKSLDRRFWNETMASEGYKLAPLEWAKQLLSNELVNLPPLEES